ALDLSTRSVTRPSRGKTRTRSSATARRSRRPTPATAHPVGAAGELAGSFSPARTKRVVHGPHTDCLGRAQPGVHESLPTRGTLDVGAYVLCRFPQPTAR